MRNTSSTLRRAISRQQTDRVFLVLLEIDHPDRLPDHADADLRGAWLNSEVAKTPNDYSPAADHMTAVADPTWPVEGVTLNGSSQHLERTESDWRPDTIGGVTAWIKPAAVGVDQVIFSSADEGGTVRYFCVRLSAGNKLQVVQRDNDTADIVEGSTVFVADEWKFVTAVGVGDSFALYVNGLAETLNVVSGADNGDWLGKTTLRDNVVIGALKRSSITERFEGTIRDLRYYSRAPSSREVYSLYRAGLFTPIRVVNNTVSVPASGKLYIPFPFQVNMPDEREDKASGVQLRIDNVDQQIVDALRQLDTAPTVSLSVVLDSDPDTAEAGPFLFTLRRASYDAGSVVGELEYEDVMREPIPGHTFTPSDFPGIFAGVS